ncbi:hypothetical protein HanXRQr2_Chr16g0761511 [Helianthus annuus]|uniref:Uncharacterized protein n=1 Tax=Helianthus annuus TaxID=4232 RepID=A0A9K3DUT6_HELAN|nr:hypothetical protein HanXRQr2_Chr16g0761511 [Helianthus annuus]
MAFVTKAPKNGHNLPYAYGQGIALTSRRLVMVSNLSLSIHKISQNGQIFISINHIQRF